MALTESEKTELKNDQFTIERVGEDKFEKVIKEAYNG